MLASIREFAPLRDGDHPRRRRGHRDHRRPGRAQDPRGARRAAGAGRRPDQEPRRAALPGADDRDRPLQHLRAAVRASSAASSPRSPSTRPLGPFFATLLNNASTTDLWGSVVKTTLFGAIIAIVSCYKGMTASGGAEGVGRAVNQGVVIEFLGIFAFNYVFTQTLLATHPEISVIKYIGHVDLALGPEGLDRVIRRHREVLRARRRERLQRARLPLLRRGAAAGRHPDPRLRPRDLGARLHPRPPVRNRGGVFQPLHRRPRLRGHVHRVVQPTRDHALRLRLHDVRQGRDGPGGGDRRDAHLG